MLNPQIAAMFVGGQQLLQSVTGEEIEIGSETYTCLPSDLILGNRDWQQGGAFDMAQISVSVLKADLETAPLTNTLATFRGVAMRVISTNDADTFWVVQLVQEKA
jgi:hypothetical protein